MRFLQADYLFPLHSPPIKKGVLQVDKFGFIIGLYTPDQLPNIKIEYFPGIICPGFINSHCHLELSHMHNYISKDTGLINFIKKIKERNSFSSSEIQDAIRKSENQMIKNGIVGVGDICNTLDTLKLKSKSKLRYYNFIEVFEVFKNKVDFTLSQAIKIRDTFKSYDLSANITPHSTYSVLPELMKKIYSIQEGVNSVLSIHNQETKEENQLFKFKKGGLFRWLSSINASKDIWENYSCSKEKIEKTDTIRHLLVHNTFSVKNDLMDVYYCTCPKANLYIENKLPNYSIFNIEKLCIGTDSLASNDSLSILEELLVVQNNSDFDLNSLLKIACRNGAECLGFENLGTFKIGKNPGVNLITNIDKMKITSKSFIKVIA